MPKKKKDLRLKNIEYICKCVIKKFKVNFCEDLIDNH